LHVGIAIWALVSANSARPTVLTNVEALEFGLDRNAKYRGLAWLEAAGLITVQRKLGRPPIIMILDPEARA
jgi:hypothetical protein